MAKGLKAEYIKQARKAGAENVFAYAWKLQKRKSTSSPKKKGKVGKKTMARKRRYGRTAKKLYRRAKGFKWGLALKVFGLTVVGQAGYRLAARIGVPYQPIWEDTVGQLAVFAGVPAARPIVLGSLAGKIVDDNLLKGVV